MSHCISLNLSSQKFRNAVLLPIAITYLLGKYNNLLWCLISGLQKKYVVK